MTVSPALHVAVLINSYSSPNIPFVRKSFTTAIQSASSSATTVDFFDPIIAQAYPNPSQYDLIVLSGGTADPMGTEPWVLKMHDFLRSTVHNFPKQKLMGICWGHQTICVAFGGKVAQMEKAELGITTIPFTENGSAFFSAIASNSISAPTSSGFYAIHEYHARQISSPAPHFTALAAKNQCFLNSSNTIITFQGHPEMNGDLMKMLFADVPAYMGVKEEDKEAIARNMEGEHDGGEIWKRVLEWVREE